MTEYNRTFLAFDYGERRIGVAKSDPTGMIASALTTLEVSSQKDALAKIEVLINEYEPDGLIFGYPLLKSGDKSEKCKAVDKFIKKVERFYDKPIYKIDESHSSTEAASIIHAHKKKTGADKKRIDRLAAVIILQRYLDENPV